jgi:hypothetical protein
MFCNPLRQFHVEQRAASGLNDAQCRPVIGHEEGLLEQRPI